MSRTLNELIEAAVLGGAEADDSSEPTIAASKGTAGTVTSPTASLPDDVEKIASALESVARHLPEWWGEKQASGGTLNANSPTNNAGVMHAPHTQSQVGMNSHSPPMSSGGSGPVETNASKKPGGGAGSVDTSGSEHGTHHPALASNDGPANADKKIKTQRTTAALKKALSATPYADGKLKENLTNASGKGDKNIHKTASLADVRAELERRKAVAETSKEGE